MDERHAAATGDPDRRVIGVDVGGTKILAGVIDGTGAVLVRRERPTPVSSQEELLGALEDAVEELADERVAAVGFGIPSQIDQRAGRVAGSINIPLRDVDFRDRMAARFGLAVGLDNDANAAAIAEWRAGAGRGTRHMVMLTLGTGIGGGLILDGKPYRGATGAGAELGHVVVEHDGEPCQGTCTGRGHLETLASGREAGEEAQAVFGPAADAHRLVRLAEEGDARAREILAALGARLGSAIGSFLNIFEPELVVIGGGFAAAGDHLLAPAREIASRETLPAIWERARIVRAELGTAAGLVGAALVGVEALEASR